MSERDPLRPSPLQGGGVRRRLADGEAGAPPAPQPSPLRGEPCPPEGERGPRLAVGVGFRRAATPEALAALVRDALSRLPADRAGLPILLATIAEKDRPPFREAASLLGLPALALPKSALAVAEDRITVRSEAARACFGVPSVAEASALAAAGPGARLAVARISVPTASCAIAISGEA